MKVVVDGKFSLWDLRELIDNADYVRGESFVPEEFWKEGAYRGRCWSDVKPSFVFECHIVVEDPEIAKEVLTWAVDKSSYVPPLNLEAGSGEMEVDDANVAYKAYVSVKPWHVPNVDKIDYLVVRSDEPVSIRDVLIFNQDMAVVRATDEELVLAGGAPDKKPMSCRIVVKEGGESVLICERSSGKLLSYTSPNVVEEDALFFVEVELEAPEEKIKEIDAKVRRLGILAIDEVEELKKVMEEFPDVSFNEVYVRGGGSYQIRGKIRVDKLFKYPFVCKPL